MGHSTGMDVSCVRGKAVQESEGQLLKAKRGTESIKEIRVRGIPEILQVKILFSGVRKESWRDL